MVGGTGRILRCAVALALALTLPAGAKSETDASFNIGEYHSGAGTSVAYITISDEAGPYLMLACDHGFREEDYANSDYEENRLTEPPFTAYLLTERFFEYEQLDQILRFRFRVGDTTYEAVSNRIGSFYTFWTRIDLPFEGMRNLQKIKSSVDVFEILDLPGSEGIVIDFRSGHARSVAERVSEMCRQKKPNRYEDYAAAVGTVIDAQLTIWDGEPALSLSLDREGSSLSIVCRKGAMPRVSFTPANVDFFRVDRATAVLDFGMPETEPLSSGALGLSFYIPSRSAEDTSRLGNAATVIALTKASDDDAGTWQMRMVGAEPDVFYEMLTAWDYVEVMSDVSIGESGGIERFALEGFRTSAVSGLVKDHCTAK